MGHHVGPVYYPGWMDTVTTAAVHFITTPGCKKILVDDAVRYPYPDPAIVEYDLDKNGEVSIVLPLGPTRWKTSGNFRQCDWDQEEDNHWITFIVGLW
jgi:hypothetical protein